MVRCPHFKPSRCFLPSPQSTCYTDRKCSGIHSRLFCLFALYILWPVEANLKIRTVKNIDWKTLTGHLSLKTLYFKTLQSCMHWSLNQKEQEKLWSVIKMTKNTAVHTHLNVPFFFHSALSFCFCITTGKTVGKNIDIRFSLANSRRWRSSSSFLLLWPQFRTHACPSRIVH